MNHLSCIISNHMFILYIILGKLAKSECESDWLISIFIKISTHIG